MNRKNSLPPLVLSSRFSRRSLFRLGDPRTNYPSPNHLSRPSPLPGVRAFVPVSNRRGRVSSWRQDGRSGKIARHLECPSRRTRRSLLAGRGRRMDVEHLAGEDRTATFSDQTTLENAGIVVRIALKSKGPHRFAKQCGPSEQ